MPKPMMAGVGRELLRFAVARQVFCPITGTVLDVRDAVFVDATDYGGRMAVVSARAWDERREAITKALGGSGRDVYDGREFDG